MISVLRDVTLHWCLFKNVMHNYIHINVEYSHPYTYTDQCIRYAYIFLERERNKESDIGEERSGSYISGFVFIKILVRSVWRHSKITTNILLFAFILDAPKL